MTAEHEFDFDTIRDSLDHCVKCTICESACPVTAVTPLFPGPKYVGPQAERFRDAGPSVDASLDYCSSCGICTLACPQGVHIAEINSQARAVMKAQKGAAEGEDDAPESGDLQERANGMVKGMWLFASSALDDDQYAKIQGRCLASCALIDGDKTIPVRMADGRWAVKELESDAPAVDQLVSEVLQFNLAVYFIARLSPAAPTAPAT